MIDEINYSPKPTGQISVFNIKPDYLHEDLCIAVEKLEKIILEKS